MGLPEPGVGSPGIGFANFRIVPPLPVANPIVVTLHWHAPLADLEAG